MRITTRVYEFDEERSQLYKFEKRITRKKEWKGATADYADGKKFAKVNNDRIENRMDRKHLEPDNRLY